MITVREATADDAPSSAAVHIAAWQVAYAHVFPTAYVADMGGPYETAVDEVRYTLNVG